jgi:hypothetical protein
MWDSRLLFSLHPARMKRTASATTVRCRIDAAQDAKKEILLAILERT